MKILNINKFYYKKGGSETYYFNLTKLLQKKGHQVIPFSMQNENNLRSHYKKYFVKNVDYETGNIFKKINNAFKIIYSFDAKRKIVQILNEEKPDLVHLHVFQHQISPSILPEIKKRKIPIVYTTHDFKVLCPTYSMFLNNKNCEKCKGDKYYNCLLNKCSKNSFSASFVNTVEMYFHKIRKYYDLIDIFITPSEFQRKKMLEYGFPESKIINIPNFIDINSNFTKSSKGKYFIYFGRLSEEKGILTLINAMKKISNGTLYIVGTGPLKEKIKTEIKNSNLKNIYLKGYKTGEYLIEAIQGSIFAVLPSECYENNPYSILESFAFGKAVIGSKIGGIPELIDEGVNGCLFKPGNVNDLVEKINYLLLNSDLALNMGIKAREKIRDNYNSEKHYEQLISIYEKLLYKLE